MKENSRTLDQIISNLSQVKTKAESLEAAIGGSHVGIIHEEDCGWCLFIDYPTDTSHADDLSTYTVCFDNCEDLFNHMQAMHDAIQIFNQKEV